MALLTFEGFEAYDTVTQSAQATDTGSGPVPMVLTSALARTGARCLVGTGTGSSAGANTTRGGGGLFDDGDAWWRRSFTRSGSTLIVGVALRFGEYASPQGAGQQRMVYFNDTVNGVDQIGFGMNTSGGLMVGRGNSNNAFSTILATASGIEPLDTWQYYELKVVLAHTATGSFELRRGGVSIASGSSVQTISGSTINVNAVSLVTLGQNNYLDDFYVCDGSGAANNDFLGPVSVQALRPDGNHSVGWTPNTGANWEATDDTTPDDDTTYVSASTTATDLYTLTNATVNTSTVFGVQAIYRGRKTGAGSVMTRAVLDSAGTEAVSGDHGLDVNYQYQKLVRETDPATSAAWDVSAVNALRAGVRRV